MKRTIIFACAAFVAQSCAMAQTQGSRDRVAPAASAASAPPTYLPITEHQRVRQYLKDTFDPMSFVRSAASAGIGQWRGRPREWKEGDEAYARRYASSYAQHIAFTTITFGFSSLFREDNRYFPSTQPDFKPRLGYAVASTFLARDKEGRRHLSFSRILGFIGASAVSRTWQPRSSSNVRGAAINLGATIGVAAGFNVAREFLWHRQGK